uniref:Genome polyprotein n=1 Tax=White dead nettle mosaic virus TaxID=2804854 RepID=A0A7R7VBX4_9SECO|nr:polyprotein [White dead nettle mosaic virus]
MALYSSSIMQNQPTTNLSLSLHSVSPNNSNNNLLQLKVSPGIYFDPFENCTHSRALSRLSSCGCTFCCFLFKLNSFYIKEKCLLSRSNITSLVNRDFISLFKSSCLLFLESRTKSTLASRGDAEGTSNYQFGSQYDCPFPGVPGTDSQDRHDTDSWGICNDAQHLFECFSTCDQARGKFFPISREGFCWHTTCTACGASCAFSSPREGLILCIFMHYLRVSYNGSKYTVRLFSDDQYVHCSRDVAELVLLVQGGTIKWKNIELSNSDPTSISVRSDILVTSSNAYYDFGFDATQRFAKDAPVLKEDICQHSFILSACNGKQFNLTDAMMRTFLMLLPCHGYMHACVPLDTGTSMRENRLCGLISGGGLIGVNIRCNADFIRLHKEFYNGNPRGGASQGAVPIVADCDEDWCFAQGSRSSDDDYEGHIDEVAESDEVEDDTEERHLKDIVDNFLADDDDLLVIPTPRSQGRGLKDLAKRVGGLLKGVTNCVTKLHAVWDWPLDTALKAVTDVGTFLEGNKSFVSDKVWACNMCPEIQKEIEKVLTDHGDIMKLLQGGVQRLSKALDDVTQMNKSNIESIEKKVQELETGYVPGRESNEEALREAIKNLFDSVKSLSDQIGKQSERIDALATRPEPLPKPKLPKYPRPTFEPIAGEQMGIPRSKPQPVKKYKSREFPFEFYENKKGSVVDGTTSAESFETKSQSGEGSTSEFVGGDDLSKVVSTPVVASHGADDVHNVILSDIYLGSVNWSVSSGEGNILKSFSFPESIWSNNPRLKNIASFFQYYTCSGLRFTLTTTSVGMQGGTLMVCWDALACATRQKINTVIQLSNLPTAYMSASSSEKLEFEISSPSIQHMMCLSGSEHSSALLGNLLICVVNGLNAAAETSQSVAVNVWVKFMNPKFSFYTLQHELVSAQSGSLKSLPGIQSLEAIIAQGKWSTTSSTNLMELTVHPTACYISQGLVTQTALSVISSIFNRWSGSLKYRFVFGASMFVRGKIVVAAVPVAFRTEKMSVTQITSFPNIVCDLSSDTRDFSFEVPYISIGNNSVVSRESLYDTSAYNADLVVCRLHMVILDPLVMNANASNSISYFVTVQPGSDFSLYQFSGVKAEFVNRVLKQSFHDSLTCGKILGDGFSEWMQRESLLHKFKLDADRANCLCVVVSPTYRQNAPCTTLLSWLSQLFVTWTGDIVYTLRPHSHKVSNSVLIRVWYDSNGSTLSGSEFEFLTEVDPPAGCKTFFWNPARTPELVITVPFSARTKRLGLHKARYTPTDSDWLNYYNGMLVIDYQGLYDIELEIYTHAGPNFELFEQTVAPRCGRVSNAFTKLTYANELKGVTQYPLGEGRLGGPVNKAEKSPIAFKPVAPVNESPDSLEGAPPMKRTPAKKEYRDPLLDPREGDRAFDKEGEPIVFRDGDWEFDEVQAQAGCFGSISTVNKDCQMLRERKTLAKLADCVDVAHTTLNDNTENGFLSSMSFLLPLLERAETMSSKLEENLQGLNLIKDKIVAGVKSLMGESIPGLLKNAFSDDGYSWATVMTLLGGLSLLWFCKSKKKFLKKISILIMVVWSPYLVHRAWDIGKWIKSKACELFNFPTGEEACRKHSSVGMLEGAKGTFGNFTDWFSGNWATAVQSLLTILGVVASLVAWGTIPDSRSLTGFAAKFKEAGEKGKTFSNIFGGFTSVVKMCGEWSGKLVSWLLSLGGTSLPRHDCILQTMIDFNLREWVEEVRKMALAENKFVDFGTTDYIAKIRHLYDKSCAIQEAILSGVKLDVQLSMIVKECKEKCVELLNNTYSFRGMKQSRIDPLHISIIGAPGVGKSAISHVLIDNLLDYRGEPKIDRIYTRCCSDAYWSCYHQEPVILYDDLGAISSKQKLSDYAEIMGVKTNDPFSIPMAIAEEKGRHCTSKYIVSCTNILELDDSGDVVTKTAYYRRRNILVKVEMDPTVTKDEENPTKGLLFTVLGYSFEGDDQNRVIFGVKTEWNEPFLRNVNTENWVFERVDFKLFMKFVCKYTDAYMASQEKLLKGIKTYRVDMDADEVVVESQAPKPTIYLAELIDRFNNCNFSMSDICKTLKIGKMEPPTGWASIKKVTFQEMLRLCCDCHAEGRCCVDFVIKRLASCYEAWSTPAHEAFTLSRVAAIPQESLMNLVSEEKLASLKPVRYFVALASYYRMGRPNDLCEYQLCKLREHAVSDSDIPVEASFYTAIPWRGERFCIDGKEVLIWDKMETYFPRISQAYRYMPIWNGSDYWYVAPRVVESLDFSLENEIWATIMNTGFEVECNSLDFFRMSDSTMVMCIMDSVDSLWEVNNFAPIFRELLSNYSDACKSKSSVIHLILHAFTCRAKAIRKSVTAVAVSAHVSAFEKALSKYDACEEKVVCGLSKRAKILLAIGGGVVALGVIAGAVIGIKHMFSTFGSTDNSDEETVIDADAEGCGAGASSAFQTERVIRGKRAPKVVVTTLDKHGTSAGASAAFQTDRVIKGRRKPLALQVQSFGLTYDERDMEVDLKKNRRKANRRKFVDTVKQLSLASQHSNEKWFEDLLKDGVKSCAQIDKSRAISVIAQGVLHSADCVPQSEFTTDDDDFTISEEVHMKLAGLLRFTPENIYELLTNGMTTRLEKQGVVGSYGVCRDHNMLELVKTHISKMSCVVIGKRGEKYYKYNVLRLRSTFVLMPVHYIEEIRLADSLWFVCPNKVVEISFDITKTTFVSRLQDLLVWDLGNMFHQVKILMPHICNDKDWENFKKCSGVLSLTDYNAEASMQLVSVLDSIELVDSDVELPTGTYSMFDSTHTIIKGLRYRVHCMPGFCGAAIVRAGTKNIRKVIGMHVAGAKDKGVGYAEILSVELLYDAIERLEGLNITKATDDVIDLEYCQKHGVTIEGKGNLGLVGIVPHKLLPRLPAKTGIVPSAIHGMIGEVKSEPAILSAWDHRLGSLRGLWDPTIEGVKKYGAPVKPFPIGEIRIVEEHLSSFFKNFENSLKKREVNNIEIGVNGIDGTNFWAPMPMDTSAGYPYVLRRPSGKVGKSWLFEELEPYPSGRRRFLPVDEGFVSNLMLFHAQILEGVIPSIITMECPKDERRKLAKIYDKPATRTFTVLPPEINLLFRMYFGDFSAMIMETRASHFSQVGINPETLEWSELMNSFLKVGSKGFAGDYAKFDGVGAPDIYHSIVSIVNNWYDDGPINARARHCLINSIIHRNGIAGNCLMCYSQGMPSGFSMTVIFNSFVNYYYMALAWQHLVSKSRLSPQANLTDFDYYTKLVVYGDDNIVAVDDAFLEIFNLRTVASYLSHYGVTYTDDAKNPIHVSEKYVDITTVSFLKRRFVPVENSRLLWKAPLDKVSIEERCNWIRECEIPIEALNQNIDSALYEASIHGKDYFLDLQSRINKACDDVVLPQTNHKFEEMASRWWGNITNYAYSVTDLRKLVNLSSKNSINLLSRYKDVYLEKDVSLIDAMSKAKHAPAAWYVP